MIGTVGGLEEWKQTMSVNVFGQSGVRDLLDNLTQKTQVGNGSIGAGIIWIKSTFLKQRSDDRCLTTE